MTKKTARNHNQTTQSRTIQAQKQNENQKQQLDEQTQPRTNLAIQQLAELGNQELSISTSRKETANSTLNQNKTIQQKLTNSKLKQLGNTYPTASLNRVNSDQKLNSAITKTQNLNSGLRNAEPGRLKTSKQISSAKTIEKPKLNSNLNQKQRPITRQESDHSKLQNLFTNIQEQSTKL